ncbi:hypothetical protein [Crassaminicella indica]|uniref:Uncharacterized protein n=1 Tax=Crassaminicella indica TaxID=2855394 RepID=A0ABX8RCU8_9CLOT|nr:hypothetical protein [Crassaminicella indica]QXM06884.1 hypothetical protein KVH43_03945 [Crassaminicella indica]
MVLKLIFLIMLCIPIACFQIYLLADAVKDLKKTKTSMRRKEKSRHLKSSMKKNHLKIAK